MKSYDNGIDVLGDGVGDFLPWLNVAGKMMGSMGGGQQQAGVPGAPGGAPSTQQAVQQAMMQERQRQAAEKAAADAKTNQLIMYGLIGVIGFGGVLLALKR